MAWTDRAGSGWVVAMPEIAELDVTDETALREYFDVEQAAHAADRSYAVLRTWPQLQHMARQPSPYFRRIFLVAREGGRMVGTADVGLSLQDNLHLAEIEVRVLPDARRRGIGRALHDEVIRRGRAEGRTTYLVEAYQPYDAESSAATSFARTLGYVDARREDHQVLDLPHDPGPPPESSAGYDVVTWTNTAPDDLLVEYAAMRTQMLRDMPSGDVDWEPVVIDPDRIREEEARTGVAYVHVVAVARRAADGELAGYSKVFLPHGLDMVVQDDTMVMGSHRGRGLGLLLKGAVFRVLASEHPERRIVHTWNAVENAPMQRINAALGFRPVELAIEMQLKVADV